MNNRLRLVVFLLIFAAVRTGDGAAEIFSGEPDVFDDIKVQMITSVQDSKKLVDENKALKARLIGLQLEIEQYEQDIEKVDPEYMRARRAGGGKGKRSAGWSDPRGDDLIREAQNIYLSGQSMVLDAGQRLWELQLYDLQYYKQELELDLKSMEFLYRKVNEQKRLELDALAREVEDDAEKIGNMTMKIAEEKSAAVYYSKRIELLGMESRALKRRISQLKGFLKQERRH
ncbi:MAG: hypothetical protein KAR32_07155 [Candidatus Omnitrophica bacterium]|nr:hypothetical protein [Candidatus Omnitrophota bacterium]